MGGGPDKQNLKRQRGASAARRASVARSLALGVLIPVGLKSRTVRSTEAEKMHPGEEQPLGQRGRRLCCRPTPIPTLFITISLISVMSSMANLTPSRPRPESLTPP